MDGVREGLWDLADEVVPRREDARAWLARHRLPGDDRTVALVAERLGARRRGWALELSVYVLVVLAGWWLVSRDQLDWGWNGDFTPFCFAIAGLVTGDIARRWIVWGRWDRRLGVGLPVRVADLRRPAWDDLVSTRAVRRAVVLVASGVLFAWWRWGVDGAQIGATTLFIVVAGTLHAGVLLELACRRSVPAGDETALAVNDRLRGEEARHAVMSGLFLVALAPAVSGASNYTWTLVFFVGYLFVLRAVRHRYAYEQVDGRVVAR
jgi:hypothetical protein